MPSERAITSMIGVLNDVIELGGVEERTAIVPNLSVIDAAPTGLTNFIIVQDDRDGDNILAKTVPGVVYANSDKVNVLFIRGAEPIAFQQGSESPSAGLWEITPSTSTDIFYDKGQVGIGESVPRDQLTVSKTGSDGGIGISTTAAGNPYIDFEDAGALQANIFWNRIADVLEVNNAGDTLLAGISGNVGIGLVPTNKFEVISGATTNSIVHFGEADNEGGYLTSTTDHQIILSGGAEFVAGSWTARATTAALMATDTGNLTWFTNAGLVDGNVFVPSERMRLDTSGNLGIGTTGPDAKLDVLATTTQLRLTHTDGSKFVDFTLDTNHDLTVTPSSTGQVIFQPTTDSADFFQVLDADGGTPVLNVDSTNERVGIGVIPSAKLHIQASGETLRLDESSATGNPFLTFFQSGTRRSFIQHNDTNDNLILASEYGALTLKTGVAGSEQTRVTVGSGGNVGIGIVSALAQLHIDQADSAAAEPVFLLDQADVDEPFTKYIGSAAAATLTRSIVAEADVTTATRQGFVKIEIEDVGNQVTDQDYFVPFYTLA